MPAAVISSGKNFGDNSAATKDALYPAHNACEVSASIDCALEILGTISSEIAVTPADIAASIESAEPVGDKKEIVIAPFLSVFICAGFKG